MTYSTFIGMLFLAVDNYTDTQLNNVHRKRDLGIFSSLKYYVYSTVLPEQLRDFEERKSRQIKDRRW